MKKNTSTSKAHIAPIEVQEKIHEKRDDYLEDLKKLVSFPGISAHGFRSQPLLDTADWLEKKCEEYGFSAIKKIELEGAAPYLFAEKRCQNPKAPTVLLYAHYDVQPVGEISQWKYDPFRATLDQNRLFGRGTADDKSGVMAILAASHSFSLSNQNIPVNVKVLFDGEEESGSPHLEAFLKKYRKIFKADYLIVPDLINPKQDTPTITFSLRGLVEFKLKISALKKSIHSGLANGVVPDPTLVLAKLYSDCLGKKGEVLIPGVSFSTKSKIDSRIKKELKNVPFSLKDLAKSMNLKPGTHFLKKSPFSFYESLWFKPALTLIQTQVADKNNYANCIQSDTQAVFSLRLAPWQDPKKVNIALKKYFQNKSPFGCKVTYELQHLAPGFFTHPSADYFQKALVAVGNAYPKKACAMGAGLSIPFVHVIQRHLGKMKTILLGIEDPNSNPHSENESLHRDTFERTVFAIANLLQVFGQ